MDQAGISVTAVDLISDPVDVLLAAAVEIVTDRPGARTAWLQASNPDTEEPPLVETRVGARVPPGRTGEVAPPRPHRDRQDDHRDQQQHERRPAVAELQQ